MLSEQTLSMHPLLTVLALSIYQLGLLAMGCGFGFWTVIAILVDLFCLWAVFRPAPKAR